MDSMNGKTQTERLRELLDERGVEYGTDDAKTVKATRWKFGENGSAMFTEYDDGECAFVTSGHTWTPEQAVEATLGRDGESYDEGFTNGVKATLQQLYGLLYDYPTLDEIEAWADRQWEEEL